MVTSLFICRAAAVAFDNHFGVFMVAAVPNITLKNIPRDLHRTLKNRAKAHHRSLNKEVIATLQNATEKQPRPDINKWIAEAREMRSKFKRPVTVDEIEAWKIEGRRR